MTDLFHKNIEKLVQEYDDDYYENSDISQTRLPPQKIEEIKQQFSEMLNSSSSDYDDMKSTLLAKYTEKAYNALKESNQKIKKFADDLRKICPCDSCPLYTYNEASGFYELNKIPEKGCVYTNCALQDAVSYINSRLEILKTKKIKRGAHKNADLSIFDCDTIANESLSNTNRALKLLKEFPDYRNAEASAKKKNYIHYVKNISFGLLIFLVLLIVFILVINYLFPNSKILGFSSTSF